MNDTLGHAKSALALLGAILISTGCGNRTAQTGPVSARIIAAHSHDAAAYTQGLLFRNGSIYESTGLFGESTVREVAPVSGNILRKLDLPPDVFGEGLTFHKDRLFCLTWRKGIAYEIDIESLSVIKTHAYTGEGWGLTTDDKNLIMSDGTSSLRFIDAETFSVTKTVRVTQQGKPVMNINELEFVNGEIYANIYTEDRIVIINPASGHVTDEIDLSGLRAQLPVPNRAEVLNGIAYDPAADRFYLTGKRWPVLFEMEFTRSTTR